MLTKQKNLSINWKSNIRLEQAAGQSRFNVKVCRSPAQNSAAAQAVRYTKKETNGKNLEWTNANGFIGDVSMKVLNTDEVRAAIEAIDKKFMEDANRGDAAGENER